MSKLKKPIAFETTFGTYMVDELLGEGGAGRVYGGAGIDGMPIALKVLAQERANTDKRKRFKNEIAFLVRNRHPNIVTVIDHGISHAEIAGPFYVMPRYHSSLRKLIQAAIPQERVLSLFSQVLDGIEAAHLKGVVHRDLKPENILFNRESNTLAIADFGTARFTEDLVATTVETGPAQRLANFQYAAPEQRTAGKEVGSAADIYAAGLILNEMFTGVIPFGTEYLLIGDATKEYSYLDEIVAKMLRQAPSERPASVADLKGLIQYHQSEAVSMQRLSQIDGTVIKSDKIDEPLAETPPRLVAVDWNRGQLILTLDRTVTPEWIDALYGMGTYSSVMGKPPRTFIFRGNQATSPAEEYQVKDMVDHFKRWLPLASSALKDSLEEAAKKEVTRRREQLRQEREAEEQRIRVLRNIKI